MKNINLIILLLGAIQMSSCNTEFTLGDKSANDIFSEKRVAKLANYASDGDENGVNEIISQGVDVNAVGADGMTPLTWAMAAKNFKGMRILLKHGANPNLKTLSKGCAPIFLSAGSDEPKMLKILLERGGDPNFICNGQTLLGTAIFHHRWKNLHLLVESGANINALGLSGPPLIDAAEQGHFDQVLYLLNHGADYSISDRNGYTLAETMVIFPGGDKSQRALVEEFLQSKNVKFWDSRDELLQFKRSIRNEKIEAEK